MQEVVDDGGAHFGVVDDFGVVEADDVGSLEVDGVFGVIEDPAEAACVGPFAHAGK